MSIERANRIDPLNFWKIKRTLQNLKRFRDLVCYQSRWAIFVQQAPKFEEMFPNSDKEDPNKILRSEINQLIPFIKTYLSIAMESTSVVTTHQELDHSDQSISPAYKDKKVSLDVLDNYFHLPRDPSATYHHFLIDAIDRTIGHFSGLKKITIRSFLNPLRWIGIALRLPLIILEYAHLIEDKKSRRIFVQIYAWAIRILMLVLISLAIRKLGLDINWSILQ